MLQGTPVGQYLHSTSYIPTHNMEVDKDFESKPDEVKQEENIKCKYMRAAHGYLSNTTFHGISWVAEDVTKAVKVNIVDEVKDNLIPKLHFTDFCLYLLCGDVCVRILLCHLSSKFVKSFNLQYFTHHHHVLVYTVLPGATNQGWDGGGDRARDGVSSDDNLLPSILQQTEVQSHILLLSCKIHQF